MVFDSDFGNLRRPYDGAGGFTAVGGRDLLGPGYTTDYGEWVGWVPCGSPTRLTRFDGHFVFEARAVVNGAVDPTPLSYEVNVDISAPSPIIAAGPDGVINDSTPTFEFGVFESEIDPVADRFECSVDGGPFALCASPFTLPELKDGPHGFAVRAFDSVGNFDGRNGYRAFTVEGTGVSGSDTTAPATTIKLPTPWAVDGLYRRETQWIELYANEPATFECSIDGAPFETCDRDWFIYLDEGTHTLKARAIDLSDNVDQTPTVATMTIDATPPTISILSPADGSTVNSSTVPVDVHLDEPLTSICFVDDVFDFNVIFGCQEQGQTVQLGEGSHTISAVVQDQVGHVGTAVSQFTVDLPPETAIDSGPTNGEVLATNQADFTFSSEPGATFECRVDSDAFAPCASPFTTSVLASGDHTFEVRAVDAGGSPDPSPAAGTFSVTSATTTFDEGSGVLAYDDGSSINNDVLVSIDGADLLIHDSATPIAAATGCTHDDPNTLRCPLAGISSLVINVGDGDDRVEVNAAIDVTVNGGNGNDTIITDLADTLDGGPGDDTLDGGPGPDVIRGGEGTDTVTYASRSTGVEVTLDGVANDGENGEGDDIADDVENIVGGSGADHLTGDDDANRIDGGPGDDIVDGEGGSDELLGSAGADTLLSRDATVDQISCGADADRASADQIDDVDASCESIKTAPDTSIVSGPDDGGQVSNTTPTFVFSADESNVGFRCSVDGDPAVDCGSQYSTPALDDGPHTLSVAAVDYFGNTDSTPATRSFMIDTAPPVMSIVTPSTGEHVASSSVNIEFVDDGTATTVTCQIDAAPAQTCSSPFIAVLTDGSHTMTVTEQDLAQNTSTDSVAFNVDTAAPIVAVTPLATSPTNDTTPSFSVDATDANLATVTCEVDNTGAVPCGSVFTAVPLADGSHTVTVMAHDIAGNEGTASAAVVVDATSPTTTMAGPSGLQTDTTPTYTLTSSESATLQCKVDSGAYQDVSSPYTTLDLVEGTHTVYCRSVDAAGNVGVAVSKTTTIGTLYTDPSTVATSGGWGAFCTPLDFILPLGCPSGIVSHTIPAHPNGLAGNYQVNLSGSVSHICNLIGIAPGYTLYIVVDGQQVASKYKISLFDFFCWNPVSLSASKLGLTLSSATSHTVSVSVNASLQLSAFPYNSGTTLTVDISQL